ncbi:MAG: hypothetical protein WC211_02515 [Dehalococcoidia bacterium]
MHRPLLMVAALCALALLVACGGAAPRSTGATVTPAPAAPASTRAAGQAPCEVARALVLSGRLHGTPAALLRALRLTPGTDVPPTVCDFTNYPGSPGIAEAVARALATRARADLDAALTAIGARVTVIRANPAACVPRPAYACTTELMWLATQAARLAPLSGGEATTSGSGGAASGGTLSVGGTVDAAATGAAATFGGEAAAATSGAPPVPAPATGGTPPGPRPATPSSAFTEAAANAQATGQDAAPWLRRGAAAAEAEARASASARSGCSGDSADLRAIVQAAGLVQLLGADDAVADAAALAAAPLVKALARRAAAGENVGSTPAELRTTAETLGIDVTKPNWMDDPDCTEYWILRVDHEVRQTFPEDGGTLVDRWGGDIFLKLQPNGAGEGSGVARYTGRMDNQFCRWQADAEQVEMTLRSSATISRLVGRIRIANQPAGQGSVTCAAGGEGFSFSGPASSGTAAFIPDVDMPLRPGSVSPPAPDPLGILRQTGFTVTTTYTLRKG